jgi:O-6-methylguanine DNA methyltransferase
MAKNKYQAVVATFRDRVFAITRKIPRGRLMTYGSVAHALGQPGAARAVGNALNTNTDLKNIPCCRVIRSDGSVGGYRTGTQAKIKRLRGEGIAINTAGKIIDFATYTHVLGRRVKK